MRTAWSPRVLRYFVSWLFIPCKRQSTRLPLVCFYFPFMQPSLWFRLDKRLVLVPNLLLESPVLFFKIFFGLLMTYCVLTIYQKLRKSSSVDRMWLTSYLIHLALQMFGRARSSDQSIISLMSGLILSYDIVPYGCVYVIWGIRLIVGYMPSFLRRMYTIACLLSCVQLREGRTIILVQRCTWRWNSQRCSAMHQFLPLWLRLSCLGCWRQRSYTASRHLLWIIPTRGCFFLSPTWVSCWLSSWCSSRAHGSLGSTYINPHVPWCGHTGWYSTSCNRHSRFIWGPCMTAAWSSQCQSVWGIPFLQWRGGWLGLTSSYQIYLDKNSLYE